jgi:hypothetical protein
MSSRGTGARGPVATPRDPKAVHSGHPSKKTKAQNAATKAPAQPSSPFDAFMARVQASSAPKTLEAIPPFVQGLGEVPRLCPAQQRKLTVAILGWIAGRSTGLSVNWSALDEKPYGSLVEALSSALILELRAENEGEVEVA